MPQPRLRATAQRSPDDIATELQAVEERVYDAWVEITQRLDIENPGRFPNVASSRPDIAKLGNNERFLGYVDAVLEGLRKHNIDVTKRGAIR